MGLSEGGPFPYQERIALDNAFHALVNVPTGLGKTAAIILGWMWRRLVAKEDVPRRLVYCLPMRVLVEQTRDCAREWIQNLREAGELDRDVCVHILMGGEQADDWDLYPEKEAILIGTQDMLLSRALNRGYAMSRYRWPMQFGLLNNDCLWVFDEVQLMDVGVATSAQLEAFRRNLGVVSPSQCVWMSATLKPDWLNTVDFDLHWLGEPLELRKEDKQTDTVRQRHEAIKALERASANMDDAKAVAEEIVKAHQPASLTLSVFNTVHRAVQVYEALKKIERPVEPLLIHSRFRPPDREKKVAALLAMQLDGGTVAITTQVVEAGVDVSAKVLFTDLAPWASLVQRFGRCNRRGESNETKDARIYWFDTSEEQIDTLAPPYEAADLMEARKHLQHLQHIETAGPASLEKIDVPMELESVHVIRRRDLLDLFDTTPDLAGNDIDISRFIRSGDELDVQVFWRDVPKDVTLPDPEQECGKAPRREELCSVPVFGKRGFREFVKKLQGSVWRWNPLEQKWAATRQDDVYPGQTFLVRSSAGGYDSEVGWNPKSKTKVAPIAIEQRAKPDAYDRDSGSVAPWQTIAKHTEDVIEELKAILKVIPLDDRFTKLLLDAAIWHDWGKAHEVFQAALPDGSPQSDVVWAKAAGAWRKYKRPHFRHELASALAMLQTGKDDFAVYLVAAHHGKVRLSIRSLPGEDSPDDDQSKFYARGVWDGDELPEVELGGGVTAPPVRLSLQCMQLGRSDNGQPSWAERMLKLRDDPTLGPFRLAYLEALLRAADMRASKLAANRAAEQQEVNR